MIKSTKIPQSISFDPEVLTAIKKRAAQAGSTISHLVNFLCRHHTMDDIRWFETRRKHHFQEMKKYEHLKAEAENLAQTGTKW